MSCNSKGFCFVCLEQGTPGSGAAGHRAARTPEPAPTLAGVAARRRAGWALSVATTERRALAPRARHRHWFSGFEQMTSF